MRYGDIVVLGLITCVLSSCGPPQEGENTGAVGQEMSLGTLTPDNMVGAVGISVVNASTGEPSPKASGGLVVPDVVLTAAHVLDPDGTFFAFIEDDFVISDAGRCPAAC